MIIIIDDYLESSTKEEDIKCNGCGCKNFSLVDESTEECIGDLIYWKEAHCNLPDGTYTIKIVDGILDECPIGKWEGNIIKNKE